MAKKLEKLLNLIFVCLVLNSGKCMKSKIDANRFLEQNNLKQDYGRLTLSWMKVYDNGEGDRWPHGPYGSCYALVYNCDKNTCECPKEKFSLFHNLLDRDKKKLIWYRSRIDGPHKIKFGEWLDKDEKKFENQEIFKWRSENDKILLVIYESDPHRKDDILFCKKIERKETKKTKMYASGDYCSKDVVKKLKLSEKTPKL